MFLRKVCIFNRSKNGTQNKKSEYTLTGEVINCYVIMLPVVHSRDIQLYGIP